MSKKPTAKMMRPRDAVTEKELCSLPRDNISLAGTWALLNGRGGITITRQQSGQQATESVSIPRRDFNCIVDWYMRAVKVKP